MVVRLTARLSGTAFRAGYARGPASTGKRNSAPPRPIKPPRIAIGIAVRKARRERPRTARSVPWAVSDDFIRLCPFYSSDAALSERDLILSKQPQRRGQECINLSTHGFTLSMQHWRSLARQQRRPHVVGATARAVDSSNSTTIHWPAGVEHRSSTRLSCAQREPIPGIILTNFDRYARLIAIRREP
jgi:hypothetical protein